MEGLITKIDVARRQLATAIRLFFDGGDAVSIYSLATNAWEVIDFLCDKAGVDSISNQTREHITDGKDLKLHYINSPYRNFFKHADRDAEIVLPDIGDSIVDSILYLAVEDYLRLVNKSPIEFQVFQLWYLASNIEKVSAGSLNSILRAIDPAFPGIRELPRKEQVQMGRKVLEGVSSDKGLLADCRTEPAFLE
ncbi:MAG TPA: hypothetical protein VLC91_15535 [Spongiibacteraceae bacterium]|nr:hypothetical protein [Spongiibacteraceae bacterium]